ncbi:SOCS box domain-containing protein [Trichonephila inaurata madagascariensis]|uniref:SOCS box domain-containing protein n=1 Tax=Trichonephila inaurata madagascariensis TaxID=2747483 RepID=A0A8X6WVE7_9ARAC|nr:SOCS box domain-containing protein [Trichonephila inaurata madagascariensis]
MDDIYVDILKKSHDLRGFISSRKSTDYFEVLIKNFPFFEKYFVENSHELFLLKFIRMSLQNSTRKYNIASTLVHNLKNVFHEHQNRIFYVLKQDFSRILVPLCDDSNIICDMFFAFHFVAEDIIIEDRTNIDFYLQHSQVSKYIWFEEDSFVDACVYYKRPSSMETVLLYYNPSRFSERYFDHNYRVVTNMMCWFNNELLRPLDLGMLSTERYFLLIQMMKIFLQTPEPSATESVRLIWNSVPDSLISLNELNQYYGAIMDSEVLEAIFEFYSEAVGSKPSYCQPRALKHLSKCTVRSVMEMNGQLCPKNIEKLFIPRELRTYLKLQK